MPELERGQPDLEADVLRAVQYLILQEQNKPMQEIAEHFGLKSRSTLYVWVKEWEKTGAMEKARQIFLMPKTERIKAAQNQVMEEWPAILLGIVSIAKDAKKSANVRLLAAAWLNETVVKPELDAQAPPGAQERRYAESEASFNPTVVTLPAGIKRQLKDG